MNIMITTYRNLLEGSSYVINLDTSPERLNKFYKSFGHFCERISAINGAEDKNFQAQIIPMLERRSWSIDDTRFKSVACSQSHLKALKQAKKDGHEFAWIFEDDTYPTDKFEEFLDHPIKDNLEALKLCWWHIPNREIIYEIEDDNYLKGLKNFFSGGSYIIKIDSNAYKRLVGFLELYKGNDWSLTKIFRNKNFESFMTRDLVVDTYSNEETTIWKTPLSIIKSRKI